MGLLIEGFRVSCLNIGDFPIKLSLIVMDLSFPVCLLFFLPRSLSTHSRSGSSESLSVIRRGCRIDESAKAKHGTKNLSLGHRLYEFYRAPITKFWGNVVCT